jgi:hypothetical protein
MKIIGCDFHPSYQHIAMLDVATGEIVERRLEHEGGEVRSFYAGLRGERVLIGMEACGNSEWFEEMLAEAMNYGWAMPRRSERRRYDSRRPIAAMPSMY